MTAGAALLAGGARGAPGCLAGAFSFPAGGVPAGGAAAGATASSLELIGMPEAKAAQKARIKEAV